jgi:hypothetical protein
MCIKPPHGYAEVRAMFGDIQVNGGQIVAPKGWESANMIKVPSLPGWPHPAYLNKGILEQVTAALAGCVALGDGYQIITLGFFAPRGSRSHPDRLSMHSWAIAPDINADTNPRGNPMVRDIPDEWVQTFKDCGWIWGGDFPTADPMHFQWASGC